MIDHPRARVVIGGVQRFLPPDPEPTVAHANASRRIRAHAGMVRSLLLFGSSGGQVLLVSDSVDGLVRWDPVTGQALMRYTDYDFAVNELAAADLPDGRLVLAAAR